MTTNQEISQEISPKSGLTTFILCFFLGVFGIHRFYAGKIGTGILMLLTAGGLWFWVLYDLISIICKNFTDSQGRTIEIAKNPTAPRNVMLTVLGLYILLFGLIIVFGGMSVRDLSSVGKEELAALRQGNMEQAYSYTASDFKKEVNLDTFKELMNRYPQLHDNVDSTFNNVEYKDKDGLILGTLTMKDGSAIPVEISLVKEGDQWKISGIHVKTEDKKANSTSEKATDADKSANSESTQATEKTSENTTEESNNQ